MTAKRTVVTILCPGHSGSTLLELLLGAHSRVVSAGEMKIFTPDGPMRFGRTKHLCTCGGGSWRECGFWQDVDARLRAGGARPLRELDVMHEDLGRFREDNLALFDALAAASGRELVVDSSKTLARYRRLRRLEELDVRPIRLIRRPEGVVSSYAREGRDWLPWARHYARHLRASRELLANARAFELHYEALASDPERTLRPLMAWLGLEFEPSQLAFHVPPQHSVGGNGMRLRGSEAIRLDRRWETELGFAQRLAIRAVTLPARAGGSGLGGVLERLWESALPARPPTSPDEDEIAKLGRAGNRATERRPWRFRVGRLSASRRALPDFVIAGAQRGGTTSLYRYLERHPCVLPALAKEVHFFDRSRNHARGVAWYRAHFPTSAALEKLRRRHGIALTGEATPAYLQPFASDRMADLLPEARILVLLRDPVERAHSAYRLHRSKGQTTLSFADAVAEELSGFAAAGTLRRRGIYRGLLANGLYAEQLAPMIDRYRDRLLVLRSEDFFAAPAEVYERVLLFLGLPPFLPGRLSAHNRTPGEEMAPETRARLVEFYAPRNEMLQRLLGRRFGWSA